MNGRDILIYYSVLFDGDWTKIYEAICRKENFPSPEKIKEAVDSLPCKTLTLLDNEYPEGLKNCYRPPFVIYYYGDISLIQNMKKMIGVIGTRACSDYGESQTIKYTKDICKHLIIVSGLAQGIDSIAQQTAIDYGGKTVGVLGTAINQCYPKKNQALYDEIKKNHLLMSEYPPNAADIKDGFPNRNRIIAGLSNCLLITEAKNKSGTSITVMHTLGQGKTVFCVPNKVTEDSLCNTLICEGATPVLSGKDVLYYLDLIDR